MHLLSLKAINKLNKMPDSDFKNQLLNRHFENATKSEDALSIGQIPVTYQNGNEFELENTQNSYIEHDNTL